MTGLMVPRGHKQSLCLCEHGGGPSILLDFQSEELASSSHCRAEQRSTKGKGIERKEFSVQQECMQETLHWYVCRPDSRWSLSRVDSRGKLNLKPSSTMLHPQ